MDECNHFSELCPWCQIKSLQAENSKLRQEVAVLGRNKATIEGVKPYLKHDNTCSYMYYPTKDRKGKCDCGLEKAIGEQE